jgi:hypothetical protein
LLSDADQTLQRNIVNAGHFLVASPSAICGVTQRRFLTHSTKGYMQG